MVTITRELVTATTIDPPLAVTTTELMSQARALGQPEDQLEPYNYAAQEWLETICNRKFLEQTWKAYLDSFPACDRIALPFGKLRSVTHIKYTDTAGTQSTFSSSYYGVSTAREPGEIILAYAQSWPTATLRTNDPIEIQFVCGWPSAEAVPYAIRQAIRFLAAHFYEHREAVIIGTTAAVDEKEIPFGIRDLIAPWRIYA